MCNATVKHQIPSIHPSFLNQHSNGNLITILKGAQALIGCTRLQIIIVQNSIWIKTSWFIQNILASILPMYVKEILTDKVNLQLGSTGVAFLSNQ